MDFNKARNRSLFYFISGSIELVFGLSVISVTALKYVFYSFEPLKPLITGIYGKVPLMPFIWGSLAYIDTNNVYSVLRSPLFDFALVAFFVVAPVSFNNGRKLWSYTANARSMLAQEGITNSLANAARQNIRGNQNIQAGRDVNQNTGDTTIINQGAKNLDSPKQLVISLIIAVGAAVGAQVINVALGLALSIS